MDYQQPIVVRRNTNGMATTSMVSGIVAWVLTLLSICANVFTLIFAVATAGIGSILGLCLTPIYCIVPIGWLVAVITGHVAKSQIRQTGEDGSGRATAGLIMGYIGLALVVLGICISLAMIAVTGTLPFILPTEPGF